MHIGSYLRPPNDEGSFAFFAEFFETATVDAEQVIETDRAARLDVHRELVAADVEELGPDQPEHPILAEEFLAVDAKDAPTRRCAVFEFDAIQTFGQRNIPPGPVCRHGIRLFRHICW